MLAARSTPLALGVAALFALAIGACDRAPSAQGLKEWSPADHGGEQRAPGAKQGTKGSGGGAPPLVEATWRAQCAACHGPTGHGDGPQGPMFKAPDLSREEWHAKVKDEEIASTIANGKGRMPKFELPEDVVKGLVERVRSFRGR
jgi:cytochrome c oxidase cbb3-type subunit 3